MQICCTETISIFLQKDGSILVWGRDEERFGLLGLGPAIFEQTRPIPLGMLNDFNIKSIAMNE